MDPPGNTQLFITAVTRQTAKGLNLFSLVLHMWTVLRMSSNSAFLNISNSSRRHHLEAFSVIWLLPFRWRWLWEPGSILDLVGKICAFVESFITSFCQSKISDTSRTTTERGNKHGGPWGNICTVQDGFMGGSRWSRRSARPQTVPGVTPCSLTVTCSRATARFTELMFSERWSRSQGGKRTSQREKTDVLIVLFYLDLSLWTFCLLVETVTYCWFVCGHFMCDHTLKLFYIRSWTSGLSIFVLYFNKKY